MTRVAAALDAIAPDSPLAPSAPRKTVSTKTVTNHAYVAADFSLQTLASGGSVILTGGANLIPRLCAHIFTLWGAGRFAETMEVQQSLSTAD